MLGLPVGQEVFPCLAERSHNFLCSSSVLALSTCSVPPLQAVGLCSVPCLPPSLLPWP